jgi:hypothetical protein
VRSTETPDWPISERSAFVIASTACLVARYMPIYGGMGAMPDTELTFTIRPLLFRIRGANAYVCEGGWSHVGAGSGVKVVVVVVAAVQEIHPKVRGAPYAEPRAEKVTSPVLHCAIF